MQNEGAGIRREGYANTEVLELCNSQQTCPGEVVFWERNTLKFVMSYTHNGFVVSLHATALTIIIL